MNLAQHNNIDLTNMEKPTNTTNQNLYGKKDGMIFSENPEKMNPFIPPTAPDYYGGQNSPYEAIKVIRAWNLGFCLGNVVKYICRAGKKPTATKLEDLQKAKTYLELEINSLAGTKKELSFTEWGMIDFSNYCQTVEPHSISGHSKLKEWMKLKQENAK